MRLFVGILRLFDALIKAMLGNEFLCLLLGICAFAIAVGVCMKIRHVTA